jgi:tRNA pseudouridine55 synthase
MTTTNGLLLVDKPGGITSHDVVARVRTILQEKRVGHAGTLDPLATGLLVLGLGPSTRLLRFAQGEEKRYVGTVLLGVATDSLDADGAVTERRAVPPISPTQMEAAAALMRGPQRQVPPMVSAVKVGGRRLHELAREGVHVEREARDVTIDEFTLSATPDPARWQFEVRCSAGTYVRVLLSDLAASLDTLGHLTALRRISSGDHHVEQAIDLDELEHAVKDGSHVLRAPIDFVTTLARTIVNEDQERRLRMGQRVTLRTTFDESEIAAVNERGALVAILRPREDRWKPEIVLADDATEVSD